MDRESKIYQQASVSRAYAYSIYAPSEEVEQEVIDKMVENYRIAWNAPSPLLDLLFKR